MIENRVGEICDGVNSCSRRSAAQIKPARIAAKVDDQPVLRQLGEQSHDLGDEPVVVGQFEAPQTQVAVVAPGDRDHAGRHVVLELAGDPSVVGDRQTPAAATRSCRSVCQSSALNDSFLARRTSARSGWIAVAAAAGAVGCAASGAGARIDEPPFEAVLANRARRRCGDSRR